MTKKRVRERVQNHRERARARGLRPVQIWVADTRTEEFRREAHRQSLVVARIAQAEEDQAFVDAVADLGEE
jgi:hypothetical protein